MGLIVNVRIESSKKFNDVVSLFPWFEKLKTTLGNVEIINLQLSNNVMLFEVESTIPQGSEDSEPIQNKIKDFLDAEQISDQDKLFLDGKEILPNLVHQIDDSIDHSNKAEPNKSDENQYVASPKMPPFTVRSMVKLCWGLTLNLSHFEQQNKIGADLKERIFGLLDYSIDKSFLRNLTMILAQTLRTMAFTRDAHVRMVDDQARILKEKEKFWRDITQMASFSKEGLPIQVLSFLGLGSFGVIGNSLGSWIKYDDTSTMLSSSLRILTQGQQNVNSSSDFGSNATQALSNATQALSPH